MAKIGISYTLVEQRKHPKDKEFTLVFCAKVGYSTYTSPDLNRLRARVKNHKDLDLSGAANDYGRGRYNGD